MPSLHTSPIKAPLYYELVQNQVCNSLGSRKSRFKNNKISVTPTCMFFRENSNIDNSTISVHSYTRTPHTPISYYNSFYELLLPCYNSHHKKTKRQNTNRKLKDFKTKNIAYPSLPSRLLCIRNGCIGNFSHGDLGTVNAKEDLMPKSITDNKQTIDHKEKKKKKEGD